MIQLPQPGPFALPIGTPQKISLRAYIDTAGDGPDASDTLIELNDTVLDLDQGTINSIVIDLDNRAVKLQ